MYVPVIEGDFLPPLQCHVSHDQDVLVPVGGVGPIQLLLEHGTHLAFTN